MENLVSENRQKLIRQLNFCIAKATAEGIRDTKNVVRRSGPAVGLTKSALLTGGSNELVNNFINGRNRLTDSAFGTIRSRLTDHPWPTSVADVAELDRCFEEYRNGSDHNDLRQPTRSLNRSEIEARFNHLLSENAGSTADLGDVNFFARLILNSVVSTHANGESIAAINNSRVIKLALKSAGLPEEQFADYFSYATLMESYAAFRIEDGIALDLCVSEMRRVAKRSRTRLPAICNNLVGHQRQLLNRMYAVQADDILFAGLAFDASNSNLKPGIIASLPYEPGLRGDSALEYQLQGSPMDFRPARFDGKSLEEVLVGDVDQSIEKGKSEGAARLLFGLARGFLKDNPKKALRYIDRGMETLADAPSYHQTARAKGLVLEARVTSQLSARSNIGRIKDRLREARAIYHENGAIGRMREVERLGSQIVSQL